MPSKLRRSRHVSAHIFIDRQFSRVSGAAVALGLFLLCLLFFGGSSRDDSFAQIPVRLAAVVLVAYTAAFPANPAIWRSRGLIFVIACAALIALQLIPLPPEVWMHLPGRSIYSRAAELGGIAQPWRPLNVNPDAGINALFSLLPPLAALVALHSVRSSTRQILLLASLAGLSALLGFVQMTAGDGISFKLYRLSSIEVVGFFANRNHHALVESLGIAAIWGWALSDGRWRPSRRRWCALGLTCVLIVGVVVTGSRASLLAVAIAVLGAAGLWRADGGRLGAPASGKNLQSGVILLLGSTAIALTVTAIALSSRAESIQRLFSQNLADDMRWRSRSAVVRMIGDYFPAGAGFGSFPRVFRHYEPLSMVDYTYFNHAHNELFELAFEGGAGALTLLAIFLAWWTRATWRIWMRPCEANNIMMRGRLGSIVSLIILLWSTVDYPLRTPLVACIFVMACWWLTEAAGCGVRASRGETAFT